MGQLEHITAIERRLWNAADTLRANSNYASNEYFLPVMGLVFLRHAFNRFQTAKAEIEAGLPKRGGKTRALKPEDFSSKSAIFLRPKAQFDYLVQKSRDADVARTVISAMESIEADYENLAGTLPKEEYRELDDDVLGSLIRTLNPEELRNATGDVFGRIYEYFLTQFADLKAHDNGEFFTPVSLVSVIANVLEPERGVVLDPACGSGGMFVQSAHFVERRKANPAERLTFYGMEKNPTTIRLAKMNLAVHGLEGNIRKAITYYEDPHELVGQADFVMANPPFNVDEIDAGKVNGDPRLPFGLPSVTQAKGPKKKRGETGEEKKKESAGRISNGNYVWISYFYSYLNETGRAGFVMSSQASSAGRTEATIRENLVKTGDVEVMIAIRSNFFYTRTVPCELWFFNRAKPAEHRGTVLMIDARNVFRKVTRKIYDFSPEQEKNLLAMVWLHRGQRDRFWSLVSDYLEFCVEAGDDCFREEIGEEGPLTAYGNGVRAFRNEVDPFLDSLEEKDKKPETIRRFLGMKKFPTDAIPAFRARVDGAGTAWSGFDLDSGAEGFHKFFAEVAEPLSDGAKALSKEMDGFQKVCGQLVETCDKSLEAKESEHWFPREVSKALKQMGEARRLAAEKLKRVRYFRRQAAWLLERFPDGEYRDVEGLVKRVDRAEIEANDWSLTPGRYVGVAPEEVDEDFDFEETMREIHGELGELNAEAGDLAERIQSNLKAMAI